MAAIANDIYRALHNHNQRQRIYRDRVDVLAEFTDDQIFQRYRFRREDIETIVEELRGDLEVSRRKGFLSPTEQVLIALRFFAAGSYQIVVGDTLSIHRSTVSRVIFRVAMALARRARRHIKFPSQVGANRQKQLFHEQAGFPGVIGCIDCTHVRIKGPYRNEHEYVNRVGKYSLNVQVVCDAQLRLLNAVVKFPGSVHDSRILQESTVWRNFEVARPKLLSGTILGDSGYPLREWLQTPLLNPQTPAERRFNMAFVRTRVTIERCIGVIKRRFNCLRTELQYSPDRASLIICACLVLHNMAVNFGTPDIDGEDNDPDNGNPDNRVHVPCDIPGTVTGRAVRQHLIQTVFGGQ